jgi:superfamily I DNA/RNA helicase
MTEMPRPPGRRDLWLTRGFYLFWFAGLGFIAPFLTLYYLSIGLTGTEIGLIGTLSGLVTLLAAPLGAGKTETVIERICALKAADPLARVWVIRATARQEAAFRERLLRKGGMRAVFNVEFFNFYTLYRRILLLSGTPGRPLDETARAGLIRALLHTLELKHYDRVRALPGFARIIGTFLYELKQGRIAAEALARAADDDRLGDLAAIYGAYQHLLQTHRLIDREGEGWLALEALEARPDRLREVALLAIDGFDQFNPLQAALVIALGQQVDAALVTLTAIPDSAATAHHNLFSRRGLSAASNAAPTSSTTSALTARSSGGNTASAGVSVISAYSPPMPMAIQVSSTAVSRMA